MKISKNECDKDFSEKNLFYQMKSVNNVSICIFARSCFGLWLKL